MRDPLKAYHMQTHVFRARFVLESKRGDVLLTHVLGPGRKYLARHLWIRASHWHAMPHEPGDSVAIRARVEPYFRENTSEPKDYSLFNCQEWLL